MGDVLLFSQYLSKINDFETRTECTWLPKLEGQRLYMQQIIGNSSKIKILQHFGSHEMTSGLGAYCFYNARDSPGIENYINYHEKKFLCNTDLKINDLFIPNSFDLYGKKYENDTQVVTPIMYRFGYIAHVIKENLIKDERKVILEIGAGWGGLPFLINRLINCCYIIIDIPSTIMLSLFFLWKNNKRVYFDINLNNLTKDITDNYDFVFILPTHIDIIPDNFVDLVVNTDSFPEMDKYCIELYLKMSSRIIKNKGFFYDYNCNCSNFLFLKEKKKEYLKPFEEIINKIAPISAYIPACKGLNDTETEYYENLYQKN